MNPKNSSVSNEMACKIAAFLSKPENAHLANKKAAPIIGVSENSIRAFKKYYRWGQTMMLAIDKIKRDGGLQPRDAMDSPTIEDYAEAMRRGVQFPPVTLYYDGTYYWLADGFHRIEAALRAGLKKFDADIKMGEKRDALLFAVSANVSHGLRRTNADKHRVVLRLLNDPEWSQWSDNQIAKRCGVHHDLVAKLRPESHLRLTQVRNDGDGNADSSQPLPTQRKTVNKHGQETTIKIGNIGRTPKTTPPSKPQAETVADEPEPTEPEPVSYPVEANGKPIGQSQVNGVLVDDPPDVASLRANGKIAPQTVVTVVDPEPDNEPESTCEPGKDVLTDHEWLTTLPLSTQLHPNARKEFERDAIGYRAMTEARNAFRFAVRSILKNRQGLGLPPYLYQIHKTLKINDPRDWTLCIAPSEGGCGGAGRTAFGSCPKCFGSGYSLYTPKKKD